MPIRPLFPNLANERASSPSRMEANSGKSIHHSLSGRFTLKSNTRTVLKCLNSKWNGSQSRQVYSSVYSFSNHPRAQHQNHTRTHCCQQWLRRVQDSLFFSSTVYPSLSNRDDLHFIKVSLPNETEESAGKSILHFIPSSFTLKHCIGTTQACSCAKWNGSQCRQVYFWITAFKDSLSNTTTDAFL